METDTLSPTNVADTAGRGGQAAPPAGPARKPHLTIKPTSGWVPLNLAELLQFRDLLFTLAGRDLKLRYKQTVLGVIWVILQPLVSAGVFAFVFGKLAKMPTDGVPYFIFSYAGLMAWNLFSGTLSKVSGSLVGNSQLISKVFFPRLILPLSSVPSTMVDFAVAGAMMTVLMFIYRVVPGWGLLLLPVWIAFLLALGVGVGLWTASLTVSYRDVAYVLPVAMSIIIYASPVAYSLSLVPANLRVWFNINPLASLLVAFRWSLLGRGVVDWPVLGCACLGSALILVFGIYSFKRMERKFADVI
jgi:lipopolysaccharide transport system permease protein